MLQTFRSSIRYARRVASWQFLILGGILVADGQLRADDVTYSETPITDSDRNHWSFRPLQPVAVPVHSQQAWRRNEIDDFIAAALEGKGLKPQLEADRQTLLRRLTLDLTGLLPETNVMREFVEDASKDAVEKVVDDLLASDACGEHSAQNWLDLARFAETDGYEHDLVRPEAWKYRDWVIGALNRDMPYDAFVRFQIAGDLIEPNNPEAGTATQFCLSGPDMPDINSQEERQHTLLNEMTATVGEVILGLQLGCAQCHDHKYDPVSQADFYRLRANFEPAVQVKKNATLTSLKQGPHSGTKSHVMLRGDFRRPGPEVEAGVPRILESDALQFCDLVKTVESSPRAALADWLVSESHPTTARVIVNRVWQQHFGTGLFETSSDVGVMGQEPVNKELLDWLARWFIENRWSLKRLHRLIVTSATYRQRSFTAADATDAEKSQWMKSLAVDQQCRMLSRFPRRRLSGEVIRDIMLQAANVLNRKSGGPGIRPPLPDELVGTLLKDQWNVTQDESEHSRRSIYVFARRNLRYPIFEVFDRPAANESCSRRNVSTTAPQSLHLLNSSFTYEISELISNRILQSGPEGPREMARLTVKTILGREPTLAELNEMQAFLEDSVDAKQSASVSLCLSLLNSNEFIFLE